MSNEATQYVPGFMANLRLSPQQMEKRFIGAVDADLSHTAPGTLFNADDIGVANGNEVTVTGRAPPTPEGFADHKRRVGFFEAKANQRWIETLEKVRMLVDPTNPIMESMMAEKNRGSDDRIIQGLFENSRNGQNGETSTAFPAAQIIAVDNRDFIHDAEVLPGSGNLPLTVGKLIKAKIMLDQSELEGERYFACSSIQLGNLLSSTPVTSADYNTIGALAAGKTDDFMGFKFIRSERLTVATNIRRCAAWVKPAIQYKERPITNAQLTQRADRSYRWQAYYEVERGCLRRYDEGVVQVLCTEVVF
jgi:hypothetical protein